MSRKARRLRRWLFIPPVILGLVILVAIVQSRPPPALAEDPGAVHQVRVIAAPILDVVPTAQGYGPVEPARVWKAVPQVAARVTALHPNLNNGEIIAAGERLVSLDKTTFELNLAELDAEFAELQIQESNTEASLRIERRRLRLAEQELERYRELAAQKSVSESQVQEVESAALAARSSVQNLENTLALIPAQLRVLEARKARAERDLGYTEIHAPFDLRVANREVEVDQYVAVGQVLFQGDGVEEVEIVAQVPPAQLRHLVLGRAPEGLSLARFKDMDLTRMLQIQATVRMELGDLIPTWAARVERISDVVDPATRTIGVVVAVDEPFDKVVPGERPPLSKGMFVEVVLRGGPLPEQVVVPREAVRNGRVWIVDDEGRLRSRAVELRFEQPGLSVIRSGLAGGETVVISDPTPVVEGMPVRTEADADSARALRAAAGGGL